MGKDFAFSDIQCIYVLAKWWKMYHTKIESLREELYAVEQEGKKKFGYKA